MTNNDKDSVGTPSTQSGGTTTFGFSSPTGSDQSVSDFQDKPVAPENPSLLKKAGDTLGFDTATGTAEWGIWGSSLAANHLPHTEVIQLPLHVAGAMTASADQVQRSGFNGYNLGRAASRAGTWLAPDLLTAAPFYAGNAMFAVGEKIDEDLHASMTDPRATNRSGYHATPEAETEIVEARHQGPSEFDEEPVTSFKFDRDQVKPGSNSKLSL